MSAAVGRDPTHMQAMLKLLSLVLTGAKAGKALTTGGTMLLSIGVYAVAYGWPFAAGLVGLIFVHEMGHYLAARWRGLDVGAPTFIPFVGAWIELRDQPRDAETEAHVAIAGPLLGSFAAFGVYFAAEWWGSPLLLALAYTGFVLNLFNLLPLHPLDGGRITAVLSPRIWLLGAPLLGGLFLLQPNPMLLLVGLLALPSLMRAWRFDPKAPENAAYYAVPWAVRLEYAASYLGLVAVLAAMALRSFALLRPEAVAGL